MERSRASNTFTARSEPHNRDEIHADALDKLALSYAVMICAPAAGRPAFRVGVWDGTAESAARTAQMITSLKRASKVFEVLEGGVAERRPGRRKLNVFARWAISTAAISSNTVRMSSHRILGKAERLPAELAA